VLVQVARTSRAMTIGHGLAFSVAVKSL
jgi:hypothetical protein